MKRSSDITTLKKNVESLYKAVYQGNGTPSIVNQITKLNEQVSALEDKFDSKFQSLETEISLKFKNITDVVTEKFSNLSAQIDTEFTLEKNAVDKKWSHKTAFTTGLLASVTSVTVVLLTELLKRLH